VNITSLLSELKIPHRTSGHEHVRDGWVGIDCPWCSQGLGRYRLGINLSRGYANCWKCGSKRLVDVLIAVTDLSAGEVLRLLSDVGWERVKRTEVKGRLLLPSGLGDLGPIHRRYLRQRGFDPDVIASLWGIRGIGLSDTFSWRIWIPITRFGEVVSWTSRSIGERAVRYVTAKPEEESVPAKHVLYGADLARHAIIICEGPLDAWAVGPGGVATLGLAFTRHQVVEMGRFPVRVVCFDSESDAQDRAGELAKMLKMLPGDTFVAELESGKDAASADPEELRDLRKRYLA